jgi:hypothetical protein
MFAGVIVLACSTPHPIDLHPLHLLSYEQLCIVCTAKGVCEAADMRAACVDTLVLMYPCRGKARGWTSHKQANLSSSTTALGLILGVPVCAAMAFAALSQTPASTDRG